MGKLKNRKLKRRNHHQPIDIPSEKELIKEEELIETDDISKAVSAALENIKSFSTEDKECGASIIARMVDNEKFAYHLTECGGIKVIAPLLVHSSLAVRHSVCGCLRNLSMRPDVADKMVKQDIMTPLVALFKLYSSKWVPSAQTNGKIDSRKEIFIEACNLLSCLCESSNIALDAFNQNGVIDVLLPCLNVGNFSLDVTLAVVECLQTVTENNPMAIAKFGKAEANELCSLLSIAPTECGHVQLRTTVAGVILNLCGGKMDVCNPSVCSILNVLEQTLNIPVQSEVEKIAEGINSFTEESKNKNADTDELQKRHSTILGELKPLECILRAKQTTLEIIANLCSSDEEAVDETASSTSSEDAEFEDVSSIPIDLPRSIPCEVLEFIVNKKILQNVLQQIVIPNDKIKQLFLQFSPEAQVLKRLHTVRCRALICINNIVQELSINELGGAQELFQLWMDLSILVFSQTTPSDAEQLEAATGSVRAVLQKLAEAHSAPQFSNMTENDLKLFFTIWQQCSDPGAKINILRSIATIGCILSDLKQPNSCNLIKIIGAFLIESCIHSSELWVISEALDSIFDVFSEDHLDCIAQEINLVEKLKQILPLFKGKAKLLHCPPEHVPIITTSKTNLIRFLRYKEKYYKETTKFKSKTGCM